MVIKIPVTTVHEVSDEVTRAVLHRFLSLVVNESSYSVTYWSTTEDQYIDASPAELQKLIDNFVESGGAAVK